ncbi:MAG: hypothetical protein HY323_00315 [Betaproteobacteria bacterium]|nr:hypothetical protein [Betaproteobacteria bacterium]
MIPTPNAASTPPATSSWARYPIHGNYLSQKDIEICLGFDVEALARDVNIAQVRELHQTLQSSFGEAEIDAAAQNEVAFCDALDTNDSTADPPGEKGKAPAGNNSLRGATRLNVLK